MVECERRVEELEHSANDRRSAPDRRAPIDAALSALNTRKSLFVDNSRFWSMLAIVALHCNGVAGMLLRDPSPLSRHLLQTVVKFGTIDFFLISGFLLGNSFETGSPISFLKRRLFKIFLPWASWFSLMTAWSAYGVILKRQIPGSFNWATWHIFTAAARNTLIGTPLWFVPNLLFSVCILMALRRYLRTWWLGGVLFLITSFYAINIYQRWLPISHTSALGGYIFFLWLGALASRNYAWLLQRSSKLPLVFFVLLVAVTGLLSAAETSLLHSMRSPDTFNTLRLSNQLYSVAVMLLLIRLPIATWPRRIDARNQLFGVYLAHYFVLWRFQACVQRSSQNLPHLGPFMGPLGFLALSLFLTVSVFASCIAMTRFLASRRNLGWLVGDLAGARRQRIGAESSHEASLGTVLAGSVPSGFAASQP